MVLLLGFALALIVVLGFGGQLDRIADLRPRAVGLLYAALGLQLLAFPAGLMPWAPGDRVATAMSLASYGCLVVATFLNLRRIAGTWLLGVGMALNLATILVNGGHMPATADALRAVGIVEHGVHNNSVTLSHPALPWLVDRFAVPHPVPLAGIFSAGDLVIVLGAGALLWAATGARLRRRPAAPQEYPKVLADPLQIASVDATDERARPTDRDYRAESPAYAENEVRTVVPEVLGRSPTLDAQPTPSAENRAEPIHDQSQPPVDKKRPAVEAPTEDAAAVSLDLTILIEAIQTATLSVAGLNAVVQSVAAIQGSCSRQLNQCQAHCDLVLKQAHNTAARCVSDAETTARRLTSAAQLEIDNARRQWQAQLQNLHRTTERETNAHRARAEKKIAQIHTTTEHDRKEAEAAAERALDVHTLIAQSLETARTEITPPTTSSEQAA
jgi:cell division septum initiation protein DivIVA